MLKVDFLFVSAKTGLIDLYLFSACPEVEEADREQATAPYGHCTCFIDEKYIRAAYLVRCYFMLTDRLMEEGLDVGI